MRYAPVLLVLALAVGVAGCGQPAQPTVTDPRPLRQFMAGGVWFPAATGYWFHQYVEQDDLTAFMRDVGFTCAPASAADGAPGIAHLRCSRGFSVAGGLMSRSDSVRFSFRGNGAVEFAEAGCRYTFFGLPELSGTCTPLVARGAVYPDVDRFAQTVLGMLRPAAMHRGWDGLRSQPVPIAPLRDADELVERLRPWLFDCEPLRQGYRIGFQGKLGEVKQLRCQHFSLRADGTPPQSQQVLIRYDSIDLAVLGVEVRLDDATATLPEAINTRAADRADAAQPRLVLETRAGVRFEVLVNEVGTGSRQATREGFESLTSTSQLDLLKAYLGKLNAQWGTAPARLSHLNAAALEWYGPQALPYLEGLLSDEHPVLGAALLKYLCIEQPAASDPQAYSPDSAQFRQTTKACFDRHRVRMPKSIATMDRLLAQDLRDLEKSDARALNAFFNFRVHLFYVLALRPDATEAARALAATVAGKEGLSPGLRALISEALAQPDSQAPAMLRPDPPAVSPGKTAEQLLAELNAANARPADEIRRDLVRMGDAAFPAMIAILREGTSPKMEFVVTVLCARGPDAAGAIPDLKRILEAPAGREPGSPWPKGHAVSALACVGSQSPETTRYLISLLKGPNPFVRATVAHSLQFAFQTTEAVLALGEALSDPDQAVREVAAGTLMRMGPKAAPAIPMLARALDQKGTYLAGAAANVLRAIGTPEALAALRARGINR